MQTSCFFVLRYLNSITFITGGIGGSDFLSFQILANFEQISSASSFLFEYVFLVLVTYKVLLVVGLGLLYYYLIVIVFFNTLWLLKKNLFKACYDESSRSKFKKLVEYFLFVKIRFKQIYDLRRKKIIHLIKVELTTNLL